MPVSETRKALADSLRAGSGIANDVTDYGADILETGAAVTATVGRGFVRIPAAMLDKVADILDPADGQEADGD